MSEEVISKEQVHGKLEDIVSLMTYEGKGNPVVMREMDVLIVEYLEIKTRYEKQFYGIHKKTYTSS